MITNNVLFKRTLFKYIVVNVLTKCRFVKPILVFNYSYERSKI
jgi:hypothetical protein